MLSELIPFSPFYVCLFWAGVLLLNVRENVRSQNVWLLVMIALGVSTFCRIHGFPVIELYAAIIYYALLPFYLLTVLQEGKPVSHIYGIVVYMLFMGVCFFVHSNLLIVLMSAVNFFVNHKIADVIEVEE